jgi:hypothetical protein
MFCLKITGFFSKYLFAVFLVPMVVTVACREFVEINTESTPPRLVIYGYITSDTMQHSIKITRSSGYFETTAPEGISNARVTISTDDEIIPLAENDTVPGLYRTEANVYGRSDKTYTLDVFLDFDNDDVEEHYRSSADLAVINYIDSIGLQASLIFKNTVEVLLYAQDEPGESFYSVFVAINDSTVNSTIDDFFILPDSYFNGMYIDGVACYYLYQDRDDQSETLRIGDKITVNVNAISKEYSTYINDVKSEIRGFNPIFGGPPANVGTNIHCIDCPDIIPVSGFFTAFPSRYASTYVTEEFELKK